MFVSSSFLSPNVNDLLFQDLMRFLCILLPKKTTLNRLGIRIKGILPVYSTGAARSDNDVWIR
jgi:hypothetical protein